MIRWLQLDLAELWQQTECRRCRDANSGLVCSPVHHFKQASEERVLICRAADSRKQPYLLFCVSFNPAASAQSITFANIWPKPTLITLGCGFLRCSLKFRGLSSVAFTHLNNRVSFLPLSVGRVCLCTHSLLFTLPHFCVYLTFHLLFFSRPPGGELFEGSALKAPAQLHTTVSLLLYPDWFSHKIHKCLLSFRASNLTFKYTFQNFFFNFLCIFPADWASCWSTLCVWLVLMTCVLARLGRSAATLTECAITSNYSHRWSPQRQGWCLKSTPLIEPYCQ